MDESLFTINRYTGDDDGKNAEKTQASEAEKKILQKLKREVELRRKARKLSAANVNQEKQDQDDSFKAEFQYAHQDHLVSSPSSLDHSLTRTKKKNRIVSSVPPTKHKKRKSKERLDLSADDDNDVISSHTDLEKTSHFEDDSRIHHTTSIALYDTASENSHRKEKRKRRSSGEQPVVTEKRQKLLKSKTESGEHDWGKGLNVVNDTSPYVKDSNSKKKKNVDSSTSSKVGPISAEGGDVAPVHTKRKRKPKSLRKSRQKGSAEGSGFTVLGKVDAQVSKRVRRVLPEWLTSPTVINADLQNCQTPLKKFSDVLHPKLLKKLKANGIVNLFPVQSTVIPWLIKSINQSCFRSNDICVSAPTGSGKTLAFVLPIIQALLERIVIVVRALVILPVRELALQVYEVFHAYSQNTGLKVGLIVGKSTFADEQKNLVRKSVLGQYESLVDIIVATPGKLVDHILKTPGFSLSHMKYLVIDEADRVMEEIKQNWLQFVEQNIMSGRKGHSFIPLPGIPIVPSTHSGLIPSSIIPASTQAWLDVPQKLLFSATLSQNPAKLQALRLFQPKLFTSVVTHSTTPAGATPSKAATTGEFLGKYTTPAELEEYFVECAKAVKPLVLYHLLVEMGYRNVLCFTNSIDTTHRLYLLMKAMTKLEVREVTARMIPSKRTKVLTKFKQGKIDLIVCSDALARGMDIDNIKYVVSYDFPEHIKTYIHRIGRTARAGKAGIAISLLDKKEVNRFQKFLIDAGKQQVEAMIIDDDALEQYEDKFRTALQEVAAIVK